MKVTAKRVQPSGHWWITQGRVSVEAYRANRADWDLYDVLLDGKSLLSYKPLDQKKSWVVYPFLHGQAVPAFCSFRAMINWITYVAPGLAKLEAKDTPH